MTRLLLLILSILTIGCLSNCSYRMAGVQPLGEPLRIVISSNAASVVRSQAYLQKEVAAAIENKLGWQISPTGSARLNMTIEKEEIIATGNDSRGIATRWNISLKGNIMFTSKHGTAISSWSAIGYSSGLNDEASALELAATNAGLQISSWLETWIEQQPVQQPTPEK